MSPTDTSTGPHLESLDAGVRALLLFSSREIVTVTAVARELGLSRSTAYRILNTLKNCGMVALGPKGRGYYTGPALVDMARPLGMDIEARARLRPVLDDAMYRTGETVHVAALLGSQVLLFDGRESDNPLRASLRVGYLRPAHSVSAGKLLLSRLIPEQILTLYPEEQLLRFTPTTTATRTQLLQELADLKEQDHAVNLQEIEPGVNGVSVILEGRTWRDRIALVASVPSDRSDRGSLKGTKDQLLESRRLLIRRPH
ncbi:IclR family transcriptional regulator [Georgenia subflava]|nr:IclR family transcriptional regulator C-terminal domain-containing protein [Georgenia subflava]